MQLRVILTSMFLAIILLTNSLVSTPMSIQTASAQIPPDEVNVCQEGAMQVMEFGISLAFPTIVGSSLGALFNWFIGTAISIVSFGVMNAIGVVIFSTGVGTFAACDPILVPASFRHLSHQQKVDNLQTSGFPHLAPVVEKTVSNPFDPTSCTSDVSLTVDGTGKITNFGELQRYEISYVRPFGTFPRALDYQNNELTDFTRFVVSFYGFTGEPPAPSDTLGNVGLVLGAANNPLKHLLLASFDIADGSLTGDSLQTENDFNNRIGAWRSDVLSKPAVAHNAANSVHTFPVGSTSLTFTSENALKKGEHVQYAQSIRVKENFAPTITSNLVYKYEAVSPTGVTSGIPPKEVIGTVSAVDNCDPNPSILLVLPELTIGTHQGEIQARDISGNLATMPFTVIVEDSISPDVLPQAPIGVAVPTGSTGILAKDVAQLTAPAVFDFGTLEPTISFSVTNSLGTTACSVENSLISASCNAFLPVNEISTITWTVTDIDNNSSTIEQKVSVKTQGTNLPPDANDLVLDVASEHPTEIDVSATDGDFEQLSFQIVTPPQHGALETPLDAVFQTKFTLTGTIPRFESFMIAKVDPSGSPEYHYLIADPIGERIVAFLPVPNTGDPHVSGIRLMPGVHPHSISHLNTEMMLSTQNEDPFANPSFAVGDWDTKRIHFIGEAFGGQIPLDISQRVVDPKNFVIIGSNIHVVDGKNGGTLVILDRTNANLVREIDLATRGITPFGITVAQNDNQHVYLTDYPDNRVVKLNLDTSTIVQSIDLSNLLIDPDGAGNNRPKIIEPRDIAIYTQGTSISSPQFLAISDNKLKTVTELRLNQINNPTPTDIGANFKEISGLDTDRTSNFYVIDSDRITKFNIFGKLLAEKRIDEAITRGTFGDSLGWLDVAVDKNNNNVYATTKGDTAGSAIFTGLVKLDSNLNLINKPPPSRDIVDTLVQGTGIAVSVGPDGSVYVLESNRGVNGASPRGIVRYNSALLNDAGTVVISQAGLGIPQTSALDMVVDSQGNFYVSKTNHRIEKYSSAGVSLGWMGKCTSGQNCNVAEQHSNGFACTDATCSGSGAGNEEGQFNFDGFLTAYKRGGRLAVDEQNNVYVSDSPFLIDQSTRTPRIQKFASNGIFQGLAVPDGTPGNFVSFLDKGDFLNINDIAVADRFYVAEGAPLQRLHVFEISPFEQISDDVARIIYRPSGTYTGPDSFVFRVSDLFDTSQGTVTLNVMPDTLPPTITCPAPTVIQANTAGGADMNNIMLKGFLSGYTATDNLTPHPVVTNNAPQVLPLGDTTVQFTATDNVNLQSSCQSTATVRDDIAPTIIAPPNITIEATGPLTPISGVNLGTPTVFDAVGIASVVSIVEGQDPTALELGINTVLWTVTDLAGNTASATQTVTIVDTTPPVFDTTVPVIGIIVLDDKSTTINYMQPTVSDAVGVESVICTPAPGDRITVTFGQEQGFCIANDKSGNFAAHYFTFEASTVDDDADGISNQVDQEPNTSSNSFSDIGLGGTTSGVIVSRPSGISSNPSEISITDAISDAQGTRIQLPAFGVSGAITPNMISKVSVCNDQATMTPHVVDLTPPPTPTEAFPSEFQSDPADFVVTCDSVNVVNLASDLDMEINLSGGNKAHTTLGTHQGLIFDPLLLRATTYNFNTENVVITIGSDSFSIPPDTTMSLTSDTDGDGILDELDTDPLLSSNGFADNDPAPITSGTISRGDQTITISDELDPLGVRISTASGGGMTPATVSACSDSALVSLDAGEEIVLTCNSVDVLVVMGSVDITFTGDDNTVGTATLDAGDSISFEPQTFTVTNSGTSDVTITVNGNPVTIPSGGTVDIDTVPPVLTLPADLTVEATSSAGATVTYSVTALDDPDGPITPTCTPVSGSVFGLGTSTINCSVTDAAGNTSSGSFSVTVADTTPPTITAPLDVTLEATGLLTPVALGTPSVSDAVDSVPSVTNNAPSSFPVGTTTVTWTATDASGNSATDAQIITITDTVAPEAYNQFDPITKNVLVFGTDNISGNLGPIQPKTVTPTKWNAEDDDGKEDDKTNAELRTYEIMDAAGNKLTLKEVAKLKGKEIKVKVLSIQYDNDPVITPPKNKKSFEWSTNKDNTIKELEQKMTVGKDKTKQKVEAKYDFKKNQTKIKSEKPKTEITLPGMVLLKMSTSNGSLVISH